MRAENSILKDFAKDLSLDIFRTGCDRTNFSILKMAVAKPIGTKEIMKKFNLSSMPANRRVNQLVKVGLLKREYKKTKITATKISKIFIKIIDSMLNNIQKKIDVKSEVIFK